MRLDRHRRGMGKRTFTESGDRSLDIVEPIAAHHAEASIYAHAATIAGAITVCSSAAALKNGTTVAFSVPGARSGRQISTRARHLRSMPLRRGDTRIVHCLCSLIVGDSISVEFSAAWEVPAEVVAGLEAAATV